MSFNITWKTHAACFILSIIVSFAFVDVMYSSFLYLLSAYRLLNITGNFVADASLIVILLMIPVIILHEALHGLCYISFGGKIRFGFKGIYAYCQETSGIKLLRIKFLIVLLVPVTLISILSLFIPVYFGSLIFIMNLVGSTGDLVMALYLVGIDNNSYILDTKNGFEVIDAKAVEKLQ
ncbi:MAG: DUF3267 domain-containing protein [Bacillota bacterium]|nr:DUF3267 domain-containing protein [Bacillota bacterium]